MSKCFSSWYFWLSKILPVFSCRHKFRSHVFLRRRLCPRRSLGFCGCNRTWHKARDIVVTDPALSVCGSNTRCVKRNVKTNKCKTAARVFRLRCAIGTPVWTRLPRFPKRERDPLIKPYPDIRMLLFLRMKGKYRTCFYSSIYYSWLQSKFGIW